MIQSRTRNLGWTNQRRGGASGGGIKPADVITQNLTSGDNVINHNLGVMIHSFEVKNGNKFIAVGGNDIDINNFNINLSGGSVSNAKIQLNYK